MQPMPVFALDVKPIPSRRAPELGDRLTGRETKQGGVYGNSGHDLPLRSREPVSHFSSSHLPIQTVPKGKECLEPGMGGEREFPSPRLSHQVCTGRGGAGGDPCECWLLLVLSCPQRPFSGTQVLGKHSDQEAFLRSLLESVMERQF